MKKKITALLLTLMLMLTIGAVNASAYDSKLVNSITSNYNSALSIAGRSSFYGNCNLATAYQLQAMGIYKNGLDYSGTGSSWYSHFSTETKTTGGYNIVTISGANCLYDLIGKYGDTLYNIVYSLGTGGSSGGTHVLYIRAIIDGNVYFADSFGCTYNGTYYPEGHGTVLSLESFVSSYKQMNGNAYGCVYFSNGSTDHLTGSSDDPDDWENTGKDFSTGEYAVTASMLRIRAGAGTSYESKGLVANGTVVTVTDIKDGWGKIEYNGISGWISLEYAVLISSSVTAEPEESPSEITTTASALRVTYLSSESKTVSIGDSIVWTAGAEGGNSSKYFYAFYIYKDGQKIYSGTFSSANSVTYVPTEEGIYKANVMVTDADNNKAELFSSEIFCVKDINTIIVGDANGDGQLTAADARYALRISAGMETITGKNFVCADIDGDGKITASDAREILRKVAGLSDKV